MFALYQPITKKVAAEILSVSKRTVDNWISDGTLPEPTAIGRRVYWHPDRFYGWLNKHLGVESNADIPQTSEASRRTGRPRARPRIVGAPARGADHDA